MDIAGDPDYVNAREPHSRWLQTEISEHLGGQHADESTCPRVSSWRRHISIAVAATCPDNLASRIMPKHRKPSTVHDSSSRGNP